MKAYINIQRFDERSAFSSWLTRIAINSALMILRGKRNRPQQSLDTAIGEHEAVVYEPIETSPNPEESCMSNFLDRELSRAISNLAPTLRGALHLRYHQDATTAEVAAALSITESAAKSRLLRAKMRVRRSLVRSQKRHTVPASIS
jgi:RNA polymerase sigma-70 factor (ECF subfamily)